MSVFSGFDYGTSNCAIGVMQDGQARLQNIAGKHQFIPSTVYALDRSLIPEWVQSHANFNDDQRQAFIQSRQGVLEQAKRFRRDETIRNDDTVIFFGNEAFDEYYAMPDEGYFVKSPKSFLGSSGLHTNAIDFFEDIISAMMMHIKAQAELNLNDNITHTVIGRPVNFQGINSTESNQQAQAILSRSAKRAGFSQAEFLYEPLAAGIHFESSLTKNHTVLVVDIGGGTTDCSMVRMGPDHRMKVERENDFLGHSGERIGGNDLDIATAGLQLMPLFGMNSIKKNTLPMPTQVYWNAVSTNDLAAQSAFYNQETQALIEQLLRDTAEPALIKRLMKMRQEKQNYHIVRNAELAKIALSETDSHTVDLSYIENNLGCNISQQAFTESIQRPLLKMLDLMEDAIAQANTQPEIIYITGGSAQSPVITQAIKHRLGNIKVIDGDHFGSVATGLTLWAEKIFS